MHLLYVGVVLGLVTYVSWMGYYWIYLPKKIRHWIEASLYRLFILDIVLTLVGLMAFHGLSESLTAVIAASTLGLLATLTTICIRSCQHIWSMFRIARSK